MRNTIIKSCGNKISERLQIRSKIDFFAGQTHFLADIVAVDLYGAKRNFGQFGDLFAAQAILDHIADLDLPGGQLPSAFGYAYPEPGGQLQRAFFQQIDMLVIQLAPLAPELS